MKKRLTIVAAVAAAVALLLWFKARVVHEPKAPDAPAASSGSAERAYGATVLLFADPREAGESCGCAEIIQLVRDVRGAPGVLVREIDSRRPGEDARRYGVRVSPAVVILDAAGNEHARFEGESAATIRALRSALAGLQQSSEPAESGAVQ